MNVLAVVVASACTALALTAACYAARVVLRHLVRARRGSAIGDLVWFRISPSGEASSKGERYGPASFRGIYALFDCVQASFPYHRRGVVSTVWLREGDGATRLYVGVSSGHVGDGSPVRLFAASLDARAERMDAPPAVPTGAVLVSRRRRVMASFVKDTVETRGSVADALTSVMERAPEGSSGALVVTFEMMRNSESKRLEVSIAEGAKMRGGATSQMQTLAPQARTMVDKAVRASMAASNSTGDTSISKLVLSSATSSISTLGWDTRTHSPERAVPRSGAAAGAAALAVCVLGALVPGAALALVPALVVCVATVALALARPDALAGRWYREVIGRGEVVVPPFFWTSLRHFVVSHVNASRSDGADPDEKVGNRIAPPSGRQVISLHAAAAWELLSFPDRLSVGVSSTDVLRRGIPSTMLPTTNPIFTGFSGTEQVVDLDLEDLQFSLYTGGAPGSGKTNLLQVIFAGVVWHGMRTTAGMRITPIWGETKGNGAYEAWATARLDPRAVMVDVHNPRVYKRTDYRLALEGPRLCDGAAVADVVSNVSRLVSSFQAAYGDGIKTSSRTILDGALRTAMLMTPQEVAFLDLGELVAPDKPNVVDLAYYILGGDVSVQPGDALLRLRSQLGRDEREIALALAIGDISRYIVKGSKQQDALSSPLNKLIDLRTATMMWSPRPGRRDAYIGDLVKRFAPVVINMGAYYDHTTGGFSQTIERAISRRLLMSFNYLQWDYIKTHCGGWEEARKRVPVFYDETADIATNVTSDDVPNTLDEALKESRSRGNAYFLGCQSPSQLPEQVRLQVLGVRTKIWFQLSGQHDLDAAVYDLSSGDRKELPYSHANVRGLERGVGVGIMTRRGKVTPPFTLDVADVAIWREVLFASEDVHGAVADYVEAKAASDARKEAARVAAMTPSRAVLEKSGRPELVSAATPRAIGSGRDDDL